ncbi:myelin basic protein isoform X1 [Theropithecus gelada]|uniref:myelin basic protein isoform X1 n=1 Tax=Theropithecus gelada TaxID=9565 RepID=UPI000DC1B8A5|nr:myelin basic protein isoform X1 [Theropithecus gelada]
MDSACPERSATRRGREEGREGGRLLRFGATGASPWDGVRAGELRGILLRARLRHHPSRVAKAEKKKKWEWGIQMSHFLLKNGETNRGEPEKKTNLGELSRTTSEDNEVFGEADANQNNGTSSQDTAVTDSKRTADPKNAWQDAHPADPGSRPHLIRLFSRDAPGREDNTFKDRPSESDELQTIQEDSAATSESLDVMASQKRPSQRHGSKYLATASTMDHARHGFLPRHRDTGILDSIGRFFGGDRGVPKRGSGKVPWLKPGRSPLPSHARSQPGLCNMYKDSHHAARTAHYGSLPQKSHGRTQDENPVVHFFKNIVTPRTPPPSQGKGRGLSLSRFSWGAEGQKPGFGYGGRASDYKSAHKGFKGVDAQGTLSRIFKLGGRDSRSGSPMARR